MRAGFSRVPRSGKVECDRCGARGYDGCPWQDRHDDPRLCSCGRRFCSRASIAAHHRHHPGDPAHREVPA